MNNQDPDYIKRLSTGACADDQTLDSSFSGKIDTFAYPEDEPSKPCFGNACYVFRPQESGPLTYNKFVFELISFSPGGVNEYTENTLKPRQIIIYAASGATTQPELGDLIAREMPDFPTGLAGQMLNDSTSPYYYLYGEFEIVDDHEGNPIRRRISAPYESDKEEFASFLNDQGTHCFKCVERGNHTTRAYRFTFDETGAPSAQNPGIRDVHWGYNNSLLLGNYNINVKRGPVGVLGIYVTDQGLRWIDLPGGPGMSEPSTPYTEIRVYSVEEHEDGGMTKGSMLTSQDFKGFKVSHIDKGRPDNGVVFLDGSISFTSASENGELPGCCWHQIPTATGTSSVSATVTTASSTASPTGTTTATGTPTMTLSYTPSASETPPNTESVTPSTPPSTTYTASLTGTPQNTPSETVHDYEIQITENGAVIQRTIDLPAQIKFLGIPDLIRRAETATGTLDYSTTIYLKEEVHGPNIIFTEGGLSPEDAGYSELGRITTEDELFVDSNDGDPEMKFKIRFDSEGSAVLDLSSSLDANCYTFQGESTEEPDSSISYKILNCHCATVTATNWPYQTPTPETPSVSQTPPKTPTDTPTLSATSTISLTPTSTISPTPTSSETSTASETASSPTETLTKTTAPETSTKTGGTAPATPSQSASCSFIELWSGIDCEAPDINTNCWEEVDTDCPCPTPTPEPTATKTPQTPSSTTTASQSISTTSTVSITASPSISTTASSSCSPAELISSGEKIPEADLSGRLELHKNLPFYKNYNIGGDSFVATINGSPLPLITALNYCTRYKIEFEGDFDVEDFKIEEDLQNIFPSKSPFYTWRKKEEGSDIPLWILAKSNEVEFYIQPSAEKLPLGQTAFVKWSVKRPENSSSSSRASAKWNAAHRGFGSIQRSTEEYEEGDLVCHKGIVYRYKGSSSCTCAEPTPSQTNSNTNPPTPTKSPEPTLTSTASVTTSTSETLTQSITPTLSLTASSTETASNSASLTPFDSDRIYGWFLVTSKDCSSISRKTEADIAEQSIDASLYNDITSVIDFGKFSKFDDSKSPSDSYGCGGACLYRFTVRVKAHKENLTANVNAIGPVKGPELICDFEGAQDFNTWRFIGTDELSCVNIDGTSQNYTMEYLSYHPKPEALSGTQSIYCNCNPASNCPDWPINNPEVPDKLIIPICDEPKSNERAAESSEELPEIKKFFKCFDDYSGSTTFTWVELYIDENGWPIELPFPEDAHTNGVPDPTKTEYQEHALRCSPLWQYMVIAFEDSQGKSWKRAGYYLET